ncbi:Plastidal glycolate/glycerate translocator 1, chloroplastic [Fulvia fulva]|uniref:Plastidal glycolate/glycerate translocator 1, chloroplastic n=1 Tax=Passalora fulva TaxID=5499 RepID=A0A9Q8LC09_PASFU|nr:Plastidal glycolate/glycerate translocator 1, chloroplastic [Fulvia fulva]KAK4629353.1 Plastidal glycolate/glycerate translocator 1, chloroplastic [Fulvia fulva]KAK4629833.1 Plastidal glycolate/glycerate translocator 1, chloroplastic [Fulvia fulva]UJO14721.1 Plastidal glycolate/glycerate translocator 1, chloroplastic [Fulvia fulva]WPV12158.1 Plastidal glycolate/glycerate translocator 1, chloroplastic [Fulvia fulva]WPV27769.1 Plastidal glycolate/glycerate translocator 1, chloroplastic [Fulvi
MSRHDSRSNHAGWKSIVTDVVHTVRIVFNRSWRRTLHAWLLVPFGLCIVLAICFGFDRLISLTSVSFPASVACMILLFFALILSSIVLGERRTKTIVEYIDVPCGWALRYIGILVCPGFVVLPLSPSISGIEVGKIIVVTVVGWIVVFCFTAYLVRATLLLLGASKKGMTTRAEELGPEQDEIPMTAPRSLSSRRRPSSDQEEEIEEHEDATFSATLLQQPARAQNPDAVFGTGGPPIPDADTSLLTEVRPVSILRHDDVPRTRPERWTAVISVHLDMISYATLFVVIGIPIYYAAGYAMPIQLCLNVLTYQAAASMPGRWQQYFHPILVSSGATIVGIWVLALIRGDALADGLRDYSKELTYIRLWSGAHGAPGAGDILSSLIAASIVGLALPMFKYKDELQRNLFVIAIPNVTLAVVSLFGYPAVCYAIGIANTNSIAFASRSLTLALAQIAVENLGGNLNVGSPVAIFSGIMGVLIGMWVLKNIRIAEDDYITRGITMGANASSLATAMLLPIDPRAAAFSSLSMGLVGATTVAMTSVPPLVAIVRGVVGL